LFAGLITSEVYSICYVLKVVKMRTKLMSFYVSRRALDYLKYAGSLRILPPKLSTALRMAVVGAVNEGFTTPVEYFRADTGRLVNVSPVNSFRELVEDKSKGLKHSEFISAALEFYIRRHPLDVPAQPDTVTIKNNLASNIAVNGDINTGFGKDDKDVIIDDLREENAKLKAQIEVLKDIIKDGLAQSVLVATTASQPVAVPTTAQHPVEQQHQQEV
jgi:hypothetical protein